MEKAMPEETAESLRERAAEEDRKGNALTAAMLRKRARELEREPAP